MEEEEEDEEGDTNDEEEEGVLPIALLGDPKCACAEDACEDETSRPK